MELNFNLEEALSSDMKGIAILEGSYETNIRPGFKLQLKSIIDIIGDLSSKEQGLTITKTNSHNFFTSYDRLFIKFEKNILIGYLRTGQRKLFIKDENNNYSTQSPICVIDFFVFKQYERLGYGKELFDRMLLFEKCSACDLGYDRITPKLIKFLLKHYNLSNYITQSNGFVLYSSYFDNKNKRITSYGEAIISNHNKFSNKPAYQHQIGANLYPYQLDHIRQTPVNKLFENIYLNNHFDSVDDINSKRKIQLLKDYNDMQRKKNEDEFKKAELERRTQEQSLSNKRLDDIERKFSPEQTKFYEYNKRYEPKTVFDEKKTLLNKVIQGKDYSSYYNYVPITVNLERRKYFKNI